MKLQPICLMLCIFSLVCAAPATAKVRLSSGVRVNAFTEDLNETEGVQTLVPFEFSYSRGKLTFQVKSGYVQAELTRPQQDRAELATITDTLASASYTFSSQPVTLAGGLTLNLPTGRERLSETQAPMTVSDFDMRQFGEGLNVGVNVMAIKTFGALSAGLNAVYMYRGDYAPTGEKDQLDPGDLFMAAGKFNWKVTAPLKVSATAAYLHATADRIRDFNDFQSADLFMLGQAVEYQPKPFGFTLAVQQMLPQKAKYADGVELRTEPEKGAGNTWTAAAAIGYEYSAALTVKLVGNMRLTGESPRKEAETGRPYGGRKAIYSIGPEVGYRINPAWACQVSASYLVQEKARSVTLADDQTTTGFKLNTSVSYTF